jgi:hypothetical protein
MQAEDKPRAVSFGPSVEIVPAPVVAQPLAAAGADRIVSPGWHHKCNNTRLARARAYFDKNYSALRFGEDDLYLSDSIARDYRDIPIAEIKKNRPTNIPTRLFDDGTLDEVCRGETDAARLRIEQCMLLGSLSYPVVIAEFEQGESGKQLGKYAILDGADAAIAASIGKRHVRALVIRVWMHQQPMCNGHCTVS